MGAHGLMYTVDYGGVPVHDPSSGLLAVSCIVKEDVDSAATASIDLAPGHPAAGMFEPMGCTREITVRDGGEVIFSGRVTDVETKPIDGTCHVEAEDCTAYLNDTVQAPYANYNASSAGTDIPINAPADAGELFEFFITRHNEQLHSDLKRFVVGTNAGRAFGEVRRASGQRPKTKDEVKSKLLSLGGYLHVDYAHSPRRIDWLGEDGLGNATQSVEFGTNLLSIAEKRGSTDIVTAIVPVGRQSGGGTGEVLLSGTESVPGAYRIEDGMVMDVDAVSRYGVIAKAVSYDASDRQALADDACSDLSTLALGLTSIEVSAVDLHAIDPSARPVRVLEWVTVTGRDGRAVRMMCTGKETDVCEPAKTRYTFGAKLHTLVGGAAKTRERISAVESAAASASASAASKSRVFRGAQPSPPYSVGDLWCAPDGNIYICSTAREV